MAGNSKRAIVQLESSAGTGYRYTITKSKRNHPGRVEYKKYDPVVRKHVLFKETKQSRRLGEQLNWQSNGLQSRRLQVQVLSLLQSWNVVFFKEIIKFWEVIMINRLQQFIADVKFEMAKVSWPSWEELRSSTYIVLGLSLILIVFLFSIDFLLSKILNIVL